MRTCADGSSEGHSEGFRQPDRGWLSARPADQQTSTGSPTVRRRPQAAAAARRPCQRSASAMFLAQRRRPGVPPPPPPHLLQAALEVVDCEALRVRRQQGHHSLLHPPLRLGLRPQLREVELRDGQQLWRLRGGMAGRAGCQRGAERGRLQRVQACGTSGVGPSRRSCSSAHRRQLQRRRRLARRRHGRLRHAGFAGRERWLRHGGQRGRMRRSGPAELGRESMPALSRFPGASVRGAPGNRATNAHPTSQKHHHRTGGGRAGCRQPPTWFEGEPGLRELGRAVRLPCTTSSSRLSTCPARRGGGGGGFEWAAQPAAPPACQSSHRAARGVHGARPPVPSPRRPPAPAP